MANKSELHLVDVIKTNISTAYLMVLDVLQQKKKRKLFGEQASLVPPLWLMNDGPVNYLTFKQNGEEYFDIFVRLAGLKPNDRVLDIGCGIGRKTLPLLSYLDPKVGQYEGIDVNMPHIEWCKKHIERRYPHFRFRHIDVHNNCYNPDSKIEATDYIFPFESNSFDFVILGSVFTHMYKAGMQHYVSEINRVLKPGGRGIISYFFLNKESETLIELGKSTISLVYEVEPGCKADNFQLLESAIGHDENQVLRLFDSYSRDIRVFYGSWCGRDKYLTYQDLICLGK